MSTNNFFSEIDFSKITPAMLDRITKDPSEASGCIQCLLEKVARQENKIEHLNATIEEFSANANSTFMSLADMLIAKYMMPPWYKRVWNVIVPRDWRGIPGWVISATGRRVITKC
jgi:hypothetical protein